VNLDTSTVPTCAVRCTRLDYRNHCLSWNQSPADHRRVNNCRIVLCLRTQESGDRCSPLPPQRRRTHLLHRRHSQCCVPIHIQSCPYRSFSCAVQSCAGLAFSVHHRFFGDDHLQLLFQCRHIVAGADLDIGVAPMDTLACSCIASASAAAMPTNHQPLSDLGTPAFIRYLPYRALLVALRNSVTSSLALQFQYIIHCRTHWGCVTATFSTLSMICSSVSVKTLHQVPSPSRFYTTARHAAFQ